MLEQEFFQPEFEFPADFFSSVHALLMAYQMLQVFLKELFPAQILFLYTVTPLPRFSLVYPLGKEICYLHCRVFIM